MNFFSVNNYKLGSDINNKYQYIKERGLLLKMKQIPLVLKKRDPHNFVCNTFKTMISSSGLSHKYSLK